MKGGLYLDNIQHLLSTAFKYDREAACQGSGLRGLGIRVCGSGFRAFGLGFRVRGGDWGDWVITPDGNLIFQLPLQKRCSTNIAESAVA